MGFRLKSLSLGELRRLAKRGKLSCVAKLRKCPEGEKRDLKSVDKSDERI